MWKFLFGVVLGNDTIRNYLLKSIMKVGGFVNDQYFTTPTETVDVNDNYEVIKDDDGRNERNPEERI